MFQHCGSAGLPAVLFVHRDGGEQICVNRLQPTLAVALHPLLLSRQESRKIQQIRKEQHNQERMFWYLLPLAFLEHTVPVVSLLLLLTYTEAKSMYTQI